MTRAELIATVPVHTRNGRPFLIVLDSIPQPWRDQFATDLHGSACPLEEALGKCAFAWDWAEWVGGNWHGRGPAGLV